MSLQKLQLVHYLYLKEQQIELEKFLDVFSLRPRNPNSVHYLHCADGFNQTKRWTSSKRWRILLLRRVWICAWQIILHDVRVFILLPDCPGHHHLQYRLLRGDSLQSLSPLASHERHPDNKVKYFTKLIRWENYSIYQIEPVYKQHYDKSVKQN